ncbi:hypothetical protein FOA43_000643 [Brettanomyces nanus]|uniref:Uncharacterized protein n=1 Tax=Eeniella nana TaxID=13502 RepID=A0A875RXP6_EENNA|nr:uncharacterized protein FOA43_000643 [Brettanomyces nanus]QPG73333.1 hypothetical protein FOA43_000643 [Brettanomyces nanus]
MDDSHQRHLGGSNDQTQPTVSTSNINNEYPSMPSYTAAYATALQYTSSTSRIRNMIDIRGEMSGLEIGSGFNDESTTLDQISLEIDTHLQLLKEMQFTGYNYLKPIGISKNMRQFKEVEEQRHSEGNTDADYGEGLMSVDAFQTTTSFGNDTYRAGNMAIDEAGVVDGINDRGAEGTSILDHDLDANLSDRDASATFGSFIDEDSGEEDVIDEESNNRHGTAYVDVQNVEIPAGGQDGDEEGQFFMVSEEYQSDHGISEHSKRSRSFSFLGNSSFTQMQAHNDVPLPSTPPPPPQINGLNSGATIDTIGTVATTATINSNTVQTTGITSPLEDGIQADTSDHDMSVQ